MTCSIGREPRKGLNAAKYPRRFVRRIWFARAIRAWDRWRVSCIPARQMFAPRFILCGLVLAQLLDAFTFMYGVSRFGIGLESNGVAAGIYLASGLDGVLLVKGAVIIGTIGLLSVTADHFPRLFVWGGAAATSLGLLGFAANTASIMLLS